MKEVKRERKRLIIVSDLWGLQDADWIGNYSEILRGYFEIEFYDSCELGDIELNQVSEEKIHSQFISSGIERAVETLIRREKTSIDVLGFSVGGYIAWKAAREGLKVNSLTAVSSTRLRYENSQPHCAINLLYGENDPYKPESEWFNRFDLNKKIYREEDHRFYTKKEIAIAVCREIINKEGLTGSSI